MSFGVTVLPQGMCSNVRIGDVARPLLAIPDILRNPLREVRPNSRLSTSVAPLVLPTV